MTPLEQLQSERARLISRLNELNREKSDIRIQLGIGAGNLRSHFNLADKLHLVIKEGVQIEIRLRELKSEIKHENIRLDALRSKPKKAA